MEAHTKIYYLLNITGRSNMNLRQQKDSKEKKRVDNEAMNSFLMWIR